MTNGRHLSDHNQCSQKCLKTHTLECIGTSRDEYVSKAGCAQELIIISHLGGGKKENKGGGWGGVV